MTQSWLPIRQPPDLPSHLLDCSGLDCWSVNHVLLASESFCYLLVYGTASAAIDLLPARTASNQTCLPVSFGAFTQTPAVNIATLTKGCNTAVSSQAFGRPEFPLPSFTSNLILKALTVTPSGKLLSPPPARKLFLRRTEPLISGVPRSSAEANSACTGLQGEMCPAAAAWEPRNRKHSKTAMPWDSPGYCWTQNDAPLSLKETKNFSRESPPAPTSLLCM